MTPSIDTEQPFPAASGEAFPCGDCGGSTRTWSASDALWNRVVGSPNGLFCPNCFIDRAEAAGQRGVWRVANSVEDRTVGIAAGDAPIPHVNKPSLRAETEGALAWRAKLGHDPDRQHWLLCSADPTGGPGWHSVQPLYASPPPAVSAEDVARVIEPYWFKFEDQSVYNADAKRHCAEALAKAERIIALLRPQDNREGEG